MSTNPKANEWKEAIDSLDIGGWDPEFSLMMWQIICTMEAVTNSTVWSGKIETFQPIGTRKEIYLLEPIKYGWRFGGYTSTIPFSIHL
jgi:hypothetical protein